MDMIYMLPTKFRFIWPSDFRGEDLKKSANQKQELPMAAMFVNGSGQNEQYLEKPLGQMNRNLVGSILGRSSIMIAHLVPIC
jgi:hypothetical protein